MSVILGSISEGLLWGLLAMGVYLTYRILNVADMTVEGSFSLGAALVSRLIFEFAMEPWMATLLSFIIGAAAGLITGLLHTKLKVPALIASIITMTGLYSINLRILGQANLPLLSQNTLVTQMRQVIEDKTLAVIVIGLIVVVAIVALLKWFFDTQIGLAIRATGDNYMMSEANGINTDWTKIIGFMVANGLVGLSGGLLAQNNGYADVNMGVGAMVIGLASVVIGEAIGNNITFVKRLLAIVLGSIIYRLLLLLVLELNFNPNDVRLFSALILAVALGVPAVRQHGKKVMKNSITTKEA
ncbi:Inner membrane ABC transporter permease protein yjfF [Aerococcus viridans]|uniref:ABC transporter permease n=2 Tax=Aerococcus viridans TaxID=1377 RepID=A0AAU8UN38_9LACT|nr:ABC transporter permease [Aerococcus viridans]AMC01491.1 ABC transporter permease [Aerococcus viridans]EFG49315.1 branched-chain amino acid ABC transporter, permease protein [Aerococcus viridans ATCC 11563 = CCUG 4311]SPT62410.1 Inner membrane ABC transporter permease protein yjfF [Aerococcus viridans]SUU14966.1 Inner membrane ABC transporter permease protein yjfF [Aerococcus viridans]